MAPEIASRITEAEGLKLHYLEAGTGDPVLLLHGWPTSAFLWRNVMGKIAEKNRAIALDLPGFGKSDKPLDASYSFRFYNRVLEGFLEALGIDATGLAVHDLGGPVGLYWACRNPRRVTRLALLNTLIYPKLSWAVVLFGAACRIPGLRSYMAGPRGLRTAMRIGLSDPRHLTDEVVRGVQAPFVTPEARLALLKAGTGLHPKGLEEIARVLPSLRIPVRAIFGARDRILPDVAETMDHVARDLPQARITALPDCGHFLQEERPDEVGEMLAEFFAAERAGV